MAADEKYLKGMDKNEVAFNDKEVYARKVGLELEKRNLPYTIARESPRRRNVAALLKKYDARWMLDLHDPGEDFNPSQHVYGGKQAIADLFVHPHYKKEKMPTLVKDLYKHLSDKYSSKNLTVGVTDMDGFYYHINSRLVGVELFPWFSVDESVEFVKTLSEYLKTI